MDFSTAMLVREMLNGPKPAAPVPPSAPVAAAEVVPSSVTPNMPGDTISQFLASRAAQFRGDPQPATPSNTIQPVIEDPRAIQSAAPTQPQAPARPSPYIDPNQLPQLASSMATQAAAPRAAGGAPQIYPERFGTNDDRRIDEIQGRISADSRAQKMMRMAQMNGQTLPFALAHAMASNSFPTTSAQTTGMPSLPPLDPARMAGLGPQAGGVAGQTAIGMGMNENTAGRNQMDFYNEQGRQSLARDGRQDQNQLMLMELMRRLTADQHTQRNENRVLDNTLGNPQRQAQNEALAWLSTQAGMEAGKSLDPNMRQLQQAKLQQAMGSQGQQGGEGGTATAPLTQESLRKQREAALVADPAAMQQHLSQFPDALARQREEARLYYENGRANEPSIFNFLKTILENDKPDLVNGPDWMGTVSTDNPIGTSLSRLVIGDVDTAAAKWASEKYGVPYDTALTHYKNYYNDR